MPPVPLGQRVRRLPWRAPLDPPDPRVRTLLCLAQRVPWARPAPRGRTRPSLARPVQPVLMVRVLWCPVQRGQPDRRVPIQPSPVRLGQPAPRDHKGTQAPLVRQAQKARLGKVHRCRVRPAPRAQLRRSKAPLVRLAPPARLEQQASACQQAAPPGKSWPRNPTRITTRNGWRTNLYLSWMALLAQVKSRPARQPRDRQLRLME